MTIVAGKIVEDNRDSLAILKFQIAMGMGCTSINKKNIISLLKIDYIGKHTYIYRWGDNDSALCLIQEDFHKCDT